MKPRLNPGGPLLALCALAVVVTWSWWWSDVAPPAPGDATPLGVSRNGADRGAAPAFSGAIVPVPEPEPLASGPAGERTEGRGTEAPWQIAHSPRVDITLELPPGLAGPRAWTLIAEPLIASDADGAVDEESADDDAPDEDLTNEDAENAEEDEGEDVTAPPVDARARRQWDYTGGELAASVDLQAGLWCVRAVAEGVGSRAERVRAGATAADAVPARAHLLLLPLALLAGSARAANGASLEGLPVLLIDRLSAEEHRLELDHVGRFRFDPVLPGAYKLCYGDAIGPIVPAISLAITASGTQREEDLLPALGTIRVRVFAPDGRLVEGARVTSRGMSGGAIHLLTDADGSGLARFLPPGAYRLHALDPDHGRTNVVLELKAGEDAEADLRFRP